MGVCVRAAATDLFYFTILLLLLLNFYCSYLITAIASATAAGLIQLLFILLLMKLLLLPLLLLPLLPPLLDRLSGIVVKASASGAEDLGYESCLRWDFSGLSHTSDLKIGTPVATLPGAWHYKVSTGTGWPGVSIL